jgi:glutaconate CoA-transferase subunit A
VTDKRLTEDEAVAELADGMTVGIGGWGSRRKPMSLVRALLRSDLTDLTVVSYGGPDVGLLCAAGKVRKLVYGFVSLDSIPLEPHFRAARQAGTIPELVELDEGMLQWGLYAASLRLPFLPTRAGLGSDVMTVNPFLAAAAPGRRFLSCERVVATEDLLAEGPAHTLRIQRSTVDGVVEAPGGAHFTTCEPDYGRDEAFQREYATAAGDPARWAEWSARWLSGSEADYQEAVRSRG